MKRLFWLFFIAILGFSVLPSTAGFAAPSKGAAFDAGLYFMPGSVGGFGLPTIEDGLSQNAGLTIFQDSRGYLWIDTQDGLNRYDGYGFKIYKHDPDDPHSISYNRILSMGEDENGISIPVTITPPFWQTWWFIGSLIVGLGMLLAGGFRYRLSTIREQNIQLETQVSERTSELRAMNILLESEVEQRKRAEAELAKRAANELKQSEARFQAIFDNVAVGVAVMSLDRRPIAFNAMTEKIIGYSFDEIQDVDPRSLAVPEDRAMDDELFQELIEGKRNSFVMERRYRHKDKRIFWARVNYSLVRDLDGKPDYLVGIIEDIDDQKRAAERLAEQEADYLLNLQQRVHERTHELEEANQCLQKEIKQRAKVEKELAEKAATEAVTADRTRLARDLHDAVTQTLFSASLTAEVLPDLWEMDVEEAMRSTEELRQLTRGALAEMRTLLLELRPAALTQTHLSDLIKQLCEVFIGRSRLPITLNIEGDCELAPEVQIAIYRIAQESLNNVFKYARATQVDVKLFLSSATVHFEVCDNGIGFDMSTSKLTL